MPVAKVAQKLMPMPEEGETDLTGTTHFYTGETNGKV